MPIYEYHCQACGSELEILQKISEPPRRQCPDCGENQLKKLVSAASFQLKGTGWYATDFKDKDKPKPSEKKEKQEGKSIEKTNKENKVAKKEKTEKKGSEA